MRQVLTSCHQHLGARGKVLGGSSAINFNMFSMASRQDLDNWTELGNKGWGFDDLLPYYRKFETYHPCGEEMASKVNDKYLDASLRGTSGPIKVSCYMQPSDITNFAGVLPWKRDDLGTRDMAKDHSQCWVQTIEGSSKRIRYWRLQSAEYGRPGTQSEKLCCKGILRTQCEQVKPVSVDTRARF